MSAKQKDLGSSPAMTKIFCAGFLQLGETFFRNFFKCLQRAPFIFPLFCKRMDVQKLPKDPLLYFSALCDLPETKKNSEIKKKIGLFSSFSSRGYCRREYLTH